MIASIADEDVATGGRMILGLGVSHQSVNAALGADMPSPTAAVRRYATEVAGWLRARWSSRQACTASGELPKYSVIVD
jgi:alkanesulfonate monooxygenase SsuD/methylene tetrahydromethanopterin reductase-like flavin-dependent oxidoreductase (luciferase family)